MSMKLFLVVASLTLLLTSWSCSSPTVKQGSITIEIPPLGYISAIKTLAPVDVPYKLQAGIPDTISGWELVFVPTTPGITGRFKDNIVHDCSDDGCMYAETTLTLELNANAKPGEYLFRVEVFALDKNGKKFVTPHPDGSGRLGIWPDPWRSAKNGLSYKP